MILSFMILSGFCPGRDDRMMKDRIMGHPRETFLGVLCVNLGVLCV
jgi:hypothetical protein